MHDSVLLNIIRKLSYLLELLKLYVCNYELSGQRRDKIWTSVNFLHNMIHEMYIKRKCSSSTKLAHQKY